MTKTSGADKSVITRELRKKKREVEGRIKNSLWRVECALQDMHESLLEMASAYEKGGDQPSARECDKLADWIQGAKVAPRHNGRVIADMFARYSRLPEED